MSWAHPHPAANPRKSHMSLPNPCRSHQNQLFQSSQTSPLRLAMLTGISAKSCGSDKVFVRVSWLREMENLSGSEFDIVLLLVWHLVPNTNCTLKCRFHHCEICLYGMLQVNICDRALGHFQFYDMFTSLQIIPQTQPSQMPDLDCLMISPSNSFSLSSVCNHGRCSVTIITQRSHKKAIVIF